MGTARREAPRVRSINDFLASLNIFTSAINELMEEQLKEELGDQITIPQYRLLRLLANTKAESISEVAAFLGISNAAASKAVERLARRRLIRRSESTEDRRVSKLHLTDEGKDLLERYEAIHFRTLEGLFLQFMPEDFAQTADLLDQLSADILNHETAPAGICFRCGIYFRDKCLLRDLTKRTCYYHLHKRPKKDGGTQPEASPHLRSDI